MMTKGSAIMFLKNNSAYFLYHTSNNKKNKNNNHVKDVYFENSKHISRQSNTMF